MRGDYRTWIADVACSAFIAFLLLLTAAFPQRVPGWRHLAVEFAIAFTLYTAVTWRLRRSRQSFGAVALRTAVVIALFAFLFGAIANLQHVLVRGWMDDALLAFERAATGADASVWLQRFAHPALTEIMMFAYVIYVPMLPGVALLCYRAAGARAAYDYLLHLSLVNIACFLGFMLFPVASPMYHQPQLYGAPLNGWVFTWCGEWIRHHAHYAGGSLPSPHCAAASVMLAMLYRYDRKAFRAALPIVLILYLSTVYGRYHYASDAVAGILTAIATLTLAPQLWKGANDASSSYGRHWVHWQHADRAPAKPRGRGDLYSEGPAESSRP
ncbi:MAG: phosphatase PAP2 family protein [Bryobacteraceae bacterium]|jgi:membrane-associated phospholipid phosphatase